MLKKRLSHIFHGFSISLTTKPCLQGFDGIFLKKYLEKYFLRC
jgi:hypothetical protein